MLVFETPGQPLKLEIPPGTDEATAVAMVMAVNEKAPPHPSTLNYGCGTEPQDINLAAVKLSAGVLLATPVGPLSDGCLQLAQNSRTIFYWRYAVAKAIQALVAEFGADKADEIVYCSEDRSVYHAKRAEAFRSVMKERFGLEFPQ